MERTKRTSWILVLALGVLLGMALPIGGLRIRGGPYPGMSERYNAPEPPNLKTGRILGGSDTAKGAAPWQVSLQNNNGKHFCGGAIIDNWHILTAASCVAGLQRGNINVVTGTNDWTQPGHEYRLAEIHIHCNFDKPLYHNDLALLKTIEPIQFDENTKAIEVAILDESIEGESLWMTGWGRRELVSPQIPNSLQQLNLTYMANEDCRRLYGQDDIDLGHLCAGAGEGKGACYGDTGGPIVNQHGQLVGIGNFGVPCGYGFPDVFARVAFYNDWIRTTIQGCSIPW